MNNPNPKLNPILPIPGVPDQLIQVLNDRFREIRLKPITETAAAAPTAVVTGGPFWRTLLLRKAVVQNNIADYVPVFGPLPEAAHTIVIVRAMLRIAISADLTVRINNISANGATVVTIGSFTIPAATPVGGIVDFTSFDNPTAPARSGFSWDVTEADGSTKDQNGVASFTILWQP